MTALLELRDVHARYGPVRVLHGVTLTVGEGEVSFAGAPLTGGPEAVARRGVAHVPEGRGTFAELSVWENLRLGAYTRRGSLRDDFVRVGAYFPWLEERRNQQAGTLSGGEQQMLALARAFVLRPKLLLLDEPSLGLAPVLVAELFRIVRELNEKEGLTVLVVEQNAHLALQAADAGYVLEAGRVVLSGSSDELRSDDAVRRSYLGY